MKYLLLALSFFLTFTCAAASPELVQLVSFTFDGEEGFEFQNLGSGAAIDSNLILTNSHIVAQGGKKADLVLVCPTKVRVSSLSECSLPATVIATHPKANAALVKLHSKDAFLPSAGRNISYDPKQIDNIHVEGFPKTTDFLQSFEDTLTHKVLNSWTTRGGVLKIPSENYVHARGQVEKLALLKSTKERYFISDVTVNFGKSGGIAFDGSKNFIGIPTFSNKENKLLILDYSQLEGWIELNRNNKRELPNEVIEHYNEVLGKNQDLRQKRKASDILKKKGPGKLPRRKVFTKFLVEEFEPDQELKKITKSTRGKNHSVLTELYMAGAWDKFPSSEVAQKSISRAELARMLAFTFDLSVPSSQLLDPFSDVPRKSANARFIQACKDQGLLRGVGFFRPGQVATRAEVVHAAVVIADLPLFGGEQFRDVRFDKWYAPQMKTSRALKILESSEEGFVYPDQAVSLTEAAEILSNAKKRKKEVEVFVKNLH